MPKIKMQYYIFFFLILMVLFFPDTLVSVLHHLIVGVYELIEGILDEIVEHLFHTDRYTTQLIVFYLMLAGILFMTYRLIQYTRTQCQRFKSHYPCWCEQGRQFWQEQSLFKKIQYVSGLFLGFWCASYLFM